MPVSVSRLTRSPPKRLPNPPSTLRKLDAETYNYLNKLIRDLEISFADTIKQQNTVRRNLANVSASVDINRVVSATLSVTGPRLTSINNRVATTSTKITSVNTRTGSVSVKLTSVNTRTGMVSTKITSVNSRTIIVSTKLTSTNGRLVTLSANFDDRIFSVSSKLTSTNSRVLVVSTRLGSVNGRVVTTSLNLTSVNGRVLSASVRLTSTNTRVVTVSVKLGSVNTRTIAVSTKVTSVRGRTDVVSAKVVSVRTRTVTVSGNVTSVNTVVMTLNPVKTETTFTTTISLLPASKFRHIWYVGSVQGIQLNHIILANSKSMNGSAILGHVRKRGLVKTIIAVTTVTLPTYSAGPGDAVDEFLFINREIVLTDTPPFGVSISYYTTVTFTGTLNNLTRSLTLPAIIQN